MNQNTGNDNKALSLADQALADLAAQLDAGRSDALVAYLAFMARFHNYSAMNVLLVRLQRPDATHVAGFSRWREMGRCVRKGEKGIAILAPCVFKRREDEGDDRADEGGERAKAPVAFRTAYVFDVAQTDGVELPTIGTVAGDPGERLQALRDLTAERGIALAYADSLGGARGVSHGGRIELLSGMPPAEEFSVLAHELGHEALHKGERRAETDLRVRELEAEAVAFVVTVAAGLENGTASRDYIGLYGGDARALARSLSHVQRAAAEILDRLL